ncbi:MAG TPA: phospholipase D-like domain-containing protein [Candidatus Absconditabacterales bacterium]|nr:phospholipase D-like domain-containing protein [Candidatus Absconditabacterales bacterium]
MHKTSIILMIGGLSIIFLLLGTLSGKLSLRMNTSGHSGSLSTTLFRSTEQISWSIQDIEDLTGTLLISPDHSRGKRSKIIASANQYLDIWLYNLTHNDSKSLIKMVAKAGTPVRMILEDNKYGPDDPQSPMGWGIQVRNDDKLHTNFVHAKVFISAYRAIIQTANLTHSAFERQREHYIITHDPRIISNLHMIFNKDRSGLTLQSNDIHPNLLVCPIDCRHKIETLLRSATSSLYIQNQYIHDESILDILKQKTHIDVKINLPADDEDNKKLPEQLQPFVKLLTSPRIHSKAFLVDKRYLVVSSINFSANSLDNNREIGIIITDPQAIHAFLHQFDLDWEKSKR